MYPLVIYPLAPSVSEEETFYDLHWDDFLAAAARVGRRGLRSLEIVPYLMALLR